MGSHSALLDAWKKRARGASGRVGSVTSICHAPTECSLRHGAGHLALAIDDVGRGGGVERSPGAGGCQERQWMAEFGSAGASFGSVWQRLARVWLCIGAGSAWRGWLGFWDGRRDGGVDRSWWAGFGCVACTAASGATYLAGAVGGF